MYELKKTSGKVLTSKSVGTEPSSYEKKNLPGCGLTNVEKHCSTLWSRDQVITLPEFNFQSSDPSLQCAESDT